MKLKKNIGILFLITLILLFSIIPKISCDTIIGDSTFPAEEGDSYKWICTYRHPSLSEFFEEGSYSNVTIEKIYQGSFALIPSALIVNATRGTYNKVSDTHHVWNLPDWIVYNYSLHFIEMANNSIFFIVPIPLNLSMVCEFLKSLGDNCTVIGNNLFIFYEIVGVEKYEYNSKGFLTKLTTTYNDTTQLIYELEDKITPKIPFGRYFISYSIVTSIFLIIFVYKQKLSIIKK